MGDQVSCCDARTQLDNINNNGVVRLSSTEGEKIKKSNHIIPQMSNSMKQLIAKAQKSKYFKQKSNLAERIKQSLIYGNAKQNALYQGQIYQGLADGYGKVSFENGSFFQGNFNKGQPNNGIFLFSDSCYYVGDIEKFQASGQGLYQNIQNGYYYEGQWKKNLQNGQGMQKYSNKDQYVGSFMYGSKFGQGVYKFADGKVYQGTFYNGLSDGHGKLKLPNGDSYDGQWKLGQMHGKGIYRWKNGQKYQGQYVNGVRQNKGKYQYYSGAVYEGQWLNGLQEGDGTIIEGYDQVKGKWQGGQKVQ